MTNRSEVAWCGIDVGTQGVRAVVVDGAGARLGAGQAALTSDHRGGDGRHEQDPDDWWRAAVAAVTAATTEAGAAAGDIAGVAIDATSGTVLLEAADGSPIGPALMYDDARAVTEAAEVAAAGASLWESLGYRMQPTWALPKVVWLTRYADPAAGVRIVHQADHLARRLTGAAVATDTSNALKTGADTRTVSWPADVHGELGVDTGRLPELVLPGTPLGRISTDAARATGLPEGATVHAGMTDGCASQIAAGAVRPGSWSSALGTTLVLKGSTPDLIRDPSGAVYCHRHPNGGWLPGGASSIGAGVLRTRLPGRDLDALTRLAAERPLPTGVTYPLDGRGERFPFVEPDAEWFGQQATDDADLFASICLGVAYVERLSYDVLAQLGADVSGSVSFTGGGSRNPWWNQLRCDVLGRPGVLPEAGDAAVGMAVLAAAGTGGLDDAGEQMVRIREQLAPDAERHRALHDGYVDLVHALAERDWLPKATADAVLARTETVA